MRVRFVVVEDVRLHFGLNLIRAAVSEAKHSASISNVSVYVYYCLEEANVLSEGSDATTERDEEHDHPHHN